MRKSLKTILIFLGIPAIIIAGILSPNVPWNEVAHALIPPKFKVVILPTQLQDALLISQDGTEIHPAGPTVILPKNVSVIHGEKVEADGICIYTADVYKNSAKISQRVCIPIKEPSPAGYYTRIVATFYANIKLPYTIIGSDSGLAAWLTIPDDLRVNFYIAKLTSQSWTAPAGQSWQDSIPNHLKLYPAGYNAISPYSDPHAGISTIPYPYDQDLEALDVARNHEKKLVEIEARCKIDVIEVSSDWSNNKTYHLLITPLYPVNASAKSIFSTPSLQYLTSVDSKKYGYTLKGSSWTTKLATDVDVSFGLNLGVVSVSLSGSAGLYTPPVWVYSVPVVWITGSASEVPVGRYRVYTSIPSGAYMIVRR